MDKSMKVIEICICIALIILFMFFGNKLLPKEKPVDSIPIEEAINFDRVQ